MQSRLTRKISSGKTIEIRPLRPRDFISEDGLPISIFEGKAVQTMYEKVVGTQPSQSDNDKQLKCIQSVLKVGLVKLEKESVDVDFYLNTSTDLMECMEIFGHILDVSLVAFRQMTVIPESVAEMVDFQSQRYSKTPIEILMPSGGYTDVDAWMFNTHIAYVGAKSDARKMKEMQRAK